MFSFINFATVIVFLVTMDESRFEELYTAYAAGLYAAQTEQLQNKNNNTQEV